MEARLRATLKNDPTADIHFTVDIKYATGTTRPTSFSVRYSINGGKPVIKAFKQ